METNEIKDLIKFLKEEDIAELSIKNGDFKLWIKTKQDIHTTAAPVAAVSLPQASSSNVATVDASTNSEVKTPEVVASNVVTIKSPMIGTFYRRASPTKPILASVGDDVKKGQVLCIVEAMKLFNEIESEISGKIVKVLVDDASPIEYDQALFLIEPA